MNLLTVGVLSLLLVLILVLTTTALVLKSSRAKLVCQGKLRPKWRSLGEPIPPVEYVYSGERSARRNQTINTGLFY